MLHPSDTTDSQSTATRQKVWGRKKTWNTQEEMLVVKKKLGSRAKSWTERTRGRGTIWWRGRTFRPLSTRGCRIGKPQNTDRAKFVLERSQTSDTGDTARRTTIQSTGRKTLEAGRKKNCVQATSKKMGKKKKTARLSAHAVEKTKSGQVLGRRPV